MSKTRQVVKNLDHRVLKMKLRAGGSRMPDVHPVQQGSLWRKQLSYVGRLLYAAGQLVTYPRLPQGEHANYKYLWLRLTGSLNVSSGVTATREAPLGLIQRLEFWRGGETMVTVPAQDLFRWCHIMQGQVAELVPPSSSTGAAIPFSTLLCIPFDALRKIAPGDSTFESELVRGQIDLKVLWGTTSDLFSAGTATINASTGLDIILESTREQAGEIHLEREIRYQETTIATASTDLPIDLPRSGKIEGILLHTLVDGVPVDTLVNTVSLYSEQSCDHLNKIPWAALQNIVNQKANHGGAIEGYAYIDLTESGMLSSQLNASELHDLKLHLDVSLPAGTTRLVRVTFFGFQNA